MLTRVDVDWLTTAASLGWCAVAALAVAIMAWAIRRVKGGGR